MTDSRPSWDSYFLGVAEAVSLRSDCRRSKVGAVLVDRSHHRIVGTGYVGVAPGEPGCLSGACPRGLKSYSEVPPYSEYSDCISVHAEQNCIDYAHQFFTIADLFEMDLTMYTTRRPCDDCLKYCQDRGVDAFVWASNS